MEPQTKTCQNCKNDFTIESEDFAFYEKIKVPPPTWCFECRLQRRLSGHRNERTLYSRACDSCGENIIAIYPKDSSYKVYCQQCWWSDKWEAMEHGQEYDFSKEFFEQFSELSKKVPKVNLFGSNNVDSRYANNTWNSKNCYLVYSTLNSEDTLYSKAVDKSIHCVDCLHLTNSEFC